MQSARRRIPRSSSHAARDFHRSVTAWTSGALRRPRILELRPSRNVGRSWPLTRFQAASRISSRKQEGQFSQWIFGLRALGFSVSGASGQTGSQ